MNTSTARSLLLIAIGSVLLALMHPLSDLVKPDIDFLDSSKNFASALDEKTSKAHRSISFLRNEILSKGGKHTMYTQRDYLNQLFESSGIVIFAFNNDVLTLWSHNSLSPESTKRIAAQGKEIHQFENGWYRLLYLSDGIEEYVAAIAIKHTYPYQNTYLNNTFAEGFNVAGIVDIATQPTKGAVKLRADHQYFYLLFDDLSTTKQQSAFMYVFMAILGGFLILIGLTWLFALVVFTRLKSLSFILLTLLCISLRAFSIKAGWPAFVSELDWFNPSIYASSIWFPSLSDFLINVVVLASLSFASRYVFLHKEPNRTLGSWYPIVLLIALFTLALFVNHLLKGLVLNSGIPFDINVLTRLNGFSIGGICGAAIVYFSYLLIADVSVSAAKRRGITASGMVYATLAISTLYIALAHYLGIRDLLFVLWAPALVLILIYLRFYAEIRQFHLSHSVLVIALFAAVGAHNFIKYSQIRERNQRYILVEKLALNDDPIAELLYAEMRPNLSRDQNVRQVFEENELHTRQLLEGYIITRYFSGYWGNYNISVFPFLSDSSAWGKLPPVRPVSFKEFLRSAKRSGEPTQADGTLYYLNESRDLTNYMAIIPLHYNLMPEPDGFFVVLMSSKIFGQSTGFPSLLIDAKTGSYLSNVENYATAKYVNGKLRSSLGEYSYRTDVVDFSGLTQYPAYIIKNGFEHLVSQIDDNTTIVISKPQGKFIDGATVFSYLCVIFGLLFFMGRFLRNRLRNTAPRPPNLNQKIQLLLVALTLISMVMFASATMFYIRENYSNKNKGLVQDKMQSVLREMQEQLGDEEEITYQMTDHLSRLLSQMSFIFYTDIHLFSPEGLLMGSSQMRMFNEGLISRQINPYAYTYLALVGRTEYLHEERIGGLEYISGYTPFYNKQGELLGYLNLPYFARQAELQREIGSFLETVINIFVLLFIISILIGLFIAQWITAPLRVIRESLSAVELGKANRILGYAGNDEIGLLVAEYNTKVAELESNAERLAQSERESAWREMAKQVAHEIKNPLTPMKLNVQHLQRTLQQGDEINEGQIQRLTANLVEQIDALTAIANAFSNFAKMPSSKREAVNLSEVLSNTANLFSHFDNIQLTLQLKNEGAAIVQSDKNQLIRVFNNLIKNAIQSIPETLKGQIVVELSHAPGGFQVMIQDNGTGISPELQNKIFVPNFTTKSRGMGLGLAMSKNLIENSQGRIWYESKPGRGSRFYVWLPAA